MGFLFGERGFVDGLAGGKVVRAVLEVADELAAPQSFGEDHVGDGAGERAVGARLDRKPLVRLRSRSRQARIDRHDGAAREDLAEAADRVRHLAVGGERIAAPDDETVHLLQVVVPVAEVALREAWPHLLGFGADGAVREVVGRAEDLRQRAVEQIRRGRGVASADVAELLRLLVVAQLHHLAGDDAERLVPADRDPFRIDASSLQGVGALHRHLDAVGVVGLLRDQVPARADVAVVRLAVGVAAHARRPAVLDEDLDRAPLRATLAGARDPLALGRSRGLGLAKGHRAGDRDFRLHGAAGRDEAGHGGRRLDEFPSGEFHGEPPIGRSTAISARRTPRDLTQIKKGGGYVLAS